MDDFESFTIENNIRGTVSVFGLGEYETCSVLSDQTRRAYIRDYETVEAAKADFPTGIYFDNDPADCLEWEETLEEMALETISALPSEAPDWFDPYDAGETW